MAKNADFANTGGREAAVGLFSRRYEGEPNGVNFVDISNIFEMHGACFLIETYNWTEL